MKKDVERDVECDVKMEIVKFVKDAAKRKGETTTEFMANLAEEFIDIFIHKLLNEYQKFKSEGLIIAERANEFTIVVKNKSKTNKTIYLFNDEDDSIKSSSKNNLAVIKRFKDYINENSRCLTEIYVSSDNIESLGSLLLKEGVTIDVDQYRSLYQINQKAALLRFEKKFIISEESNISVEIPAKTKLKITFRFK